MSETTPQNAGACEQVLDYVYGELDDAGKRAFEEHLGGCARCQAEVASFGRVRTAVKRVMPPVEPPAPLGGALHAQLMHAAAARAPRRGVLLAFPRKILQHPAWAAAAMFAIVGGAIAINWSQGKLQMPAKEAAEAPAAPAAAPAAEPVTEKEEREVAADERAAAANVPAAIPADKRAELAPAPTATRHHAAAGKGGLTANAARPVAKRKTMAAKDDAFDDGMVGGAVAGSGGYGRGVATEGALKSTAPAPRPAKAEAKPARMRRSFESDLAGAVAPSPSGMAMPSAAPPPPPLPTSATAQRAEPAGPARDVEALRKRADEWARTGRCDEAIKAYQQLARLAQSVSPRERANYVRCLAATGRQQQAEEQLDALRADKHASDADVKKVAAELERAKQRDADDKAAKKPAAASADRAQTRAAQAPAEKAPPAQQKQQPAQQKQQPAQQKRPAY